MNWGEYISADVERQPESKMCKSVGRNTQLKKYKMGKAGDFKWLGVMTDHS